MLITLVNVRVKIDYILTVQPSPLRCKYVMKMKINCVSFAGARDRSIIDEYYYCH